MKQNTWVFIIAILALVAGVYLATVIAPPSIQTAKPLQEQTQYLRWYPQSRALTEFSLTDHKGQEMTNEALLGKWTLGFVGYTFCPDICPTTLAEINSSYPKLMALPNADTLQVWFLSVDPKRDTTERLNEYINYFNPNFVASTGSHDQLFPLVRSMGMMYSISESTDNPNYLVDHSASVVVINPQGLIVGRFKPKHVPGQLAISDMQQILADMPVLLASQ